MTIPTQSAHDSASPTATSARPSPSLRALLSLAFRPLYLAGAAWALVAVGVWVYAPQLLAGPLQGIAWHAHEMLWGFVATIAVAFLMTAGANWTGINPLQGPALAVACGLWAVARAGFLVDADVAFDIAAAAEISFFVLAAGALLRAVHLSKNRRNYAIPWLLVALAVADGAYLVAVRGGDFALLMRRFDAGLLVMAMLALLIARRVIPFFAMRAVPGLQIPMQTRIGHVQLAACACAAVFVLAGFEIPAAVALALAGALSLLQLLRWKPYAVRRNPLLWILYAGYAGLGAGLLVAGCAAAGVGDLSPALPVHVIAMAGFSVLIIGMLTRTALGHLGLPLAIDRGLLLAFALVLVAVALRLLALRANAFSAHALQLSAAAWIGAFAIYLWRFAPLMIRPRI
jgi:uncharacterized protein involved in response to NO